MITIDYETEAIVGNPLINPPRPIGVAVWEEGKDPEYYTGDYMVDKCNHLWESGGEMLFHNASFDLSVAHRWFRLPFPKWDLIHDTQYLVFLKNPHSTNLGLKPSAVTYLGMAPDEQDELHDWIMANIPKATKKTAGAYICEAPVDLVSKYAKGDVIRTRMLFDELIGQVPREAYDRERQLNPILRSATIRGVRVARTALGTALGTCKAAQAQCEQRIRGLLRVPNLNPHSGAELAKALDSAGKIKKWHLTPTGKKSTAKDNLMKEINDPALLKLLLYTSAMQTCIGTFIEPWLEKSESSGRLHPNWNQVRGEGFGTRTGRLSSDNPNFQNIPTEFTFEVPEGLAPMPVMRNFVLPEEGHVWLKRDFSGQEMRILAHFEDGALAQAYRDNPDLDPHEMVRQLIYKKIGKLFPRKDVKETGFGMIYGMGAPALSGRIGCTPSEAREVIEAYKLALPGIPMLQTETKNRGRNGQPIRTWGGREYYAEEPKITKGHYRSFEYKLLNYLIQGSAADQTKQAIIDWDSGRHDHTILMATVHDEINISAPEDKSVWAMTWLREAMDKDRFDVPFKTDSFKGPSWGGIEAWDV